MNLGIAGRTALVCGASKGLGRACAVALADEGVNVVLVARGAAALETTAEHIRRRAPAVEVVTVAADITSETGRDAALKACPAPDLLITNCGGPPTGDFRTWTRADWHAALDANMLAPIALMKATIDGMLARRFGRIVNITSSAVKAPVGGLGLSNGARAGLTGFVAGLARETVGRNVTINNLLPGPFDTDRVRATNAAIAAAAGRSVEDLLRQRLAGSPAGRFGEPAELGAACAFLCSAAAGFITGQNLLIDGGAYPGVF